MSQSIHPLPVLLLLVLLTACDLQQQDEDTAYRQSVEAWRRERIAQLMAPDGWLALAGLYWLEEGPNSFGSAAGHALVFPEKAPDTMGVFWRQADSVYFQLAPGLEASVAGQAVDQFTLTGQEQTPLVTFGDLSWILIKRKDKYGIRLWDHRHPKLTDTVHIEHYPVDPAWRIEAEWLPDTSGQTVRIRNVLDMEMEMETAGRLRFTHQGAVHEITALDGEHNDFFLIFSDDTSGSETYGGGRYLYADRPDENGIVYIDFNRAYNPPCAFTEYATCLLPPPENRLSLAVTAGELSYGDH